MAENQAEVGAEKSPGDIAREKVAPRGYEWYENYDRNEPPVRDGEDGWLKMLKEKDSDIVDLEMGLPAFDNQGEPLQLHGGRAYMFAAYVKRKPRD